MKSLLIILTGVLLSYRAPAQSGQRDGNPDNQLSYVEASIGEGTHLTGKFGVNIIYPSNDIIAVSLSFSTHRDPNVPSDFKKGLIATNPQQTLYMSGVCYGRVLYTNTKYIRYVVKGGLSAGLMSTPTDYEYNPGYFNSTYSFSHKTQFTGGLMINPTVEFPLKRHFGFSFGLYSNVNFSSTVAGVECSMIIGKLRNRYSNQSS